MKVRLGVELRCGACLSRLPVLVDAHDEGPRGPHFWVIPESQPVVAMWTHAHRQPKMSPTGEVLPGVR